MQPAVGDELLDRRLVFPFMINAFRRVGSDGAVGSDGSDAASLIRSSDAPSKVILIDRASMFFVELTVRQGQGFLKRATRAGRGNSSCTGTRSGCCGWELRDCWLHLSAVRAAGDDPPGQKKNDDRPTNRLAKETSPYLLLHAHNPVDWYPWGPEAFARAKAENKPIFLSVGYSSCYWCHVMERESFMDAEIAKALNAHFVCIKVDREERPDVDQIYMAALQAFGPGGWPMSMFLTPDGRPFFGGTYFPPARSRRVAGFLDRSSRKWHAPGPRTAPPSTRRPTPSPTRVRGTAQGRRGRKARIPRREPAVAQGEAQLAEQFDPEFGGFGFNPNNPRRPKFPEPVNLVFLLDQHRRGGAGMPARARPRLRW